MEKKRRARINESLQELRLLIADAEVRSKVLYWGGVERLLVLVVAVCDCFQQTAAMCWPT